MFRSTREYLLLCAMSSAFVLGVPSPAMGQFAHMADAQYDPTNGMIAPLDRHAFPRVCLEMKANPSAEQLSKYDAITANTAMMSSSSIPRAQDINPDMIVLRQYLAGGYQSYRSTNPCQDALGVPFGSAGPSTENCNYFAGHWAYYAGTTTNQVLTSSSSTVVVGDGSRLTAGRYVVIYDAPAGSFRNAEHALVRSVSGNTVTFSQRGFKSTARSHPAGSIIAEHPAAAATRGVTDPRHWRFNLSSTCPRDGNGRQMGEVMATWLAANLGTNGRGQTVDVRIDGVIFDTDAWSVAWEDRLDVNNDLMPDGGWNQSTGENYWGDGSERFYQLVRDRLPDKLLVGGDRIVRGLETLNGTQMEGWPVSGSYFSSTPEYEDVDAVLANYVVHMRSGPPNTASFVQNFSKTRTRLYPGGETPRPPSNAPFRFAFGLSLLDDGYYAVEATSNDTDPWWDEFAVDVTPDSPTYGYAIASNPSDEAQVRTHTDWLGLPLGARERVYDSSLFELNRSLIDSGGLNASSALSGWQASNVSLAFEAVDRMSGSGSLRVSNHDSYGYRPVSATVQTPAVSLRQGVDYTLVFSGKADQTRSVMVAGGGAPAQSFLIPDYWVRRAMTFTARSSGNSRINFQVGREDVRLWLDEVYLFEGNADIFKREFENGLVVVNATSRAQTVQLGSEFLRIRGTGQDAVNDGSRVTAVTLPAYDAAVLVRPASSNPSSIACGAPSYSSATETGVFLYRSCMDPRIWSFRFSAGGRTVSYRGQVASDRPFGSLAGIGQGGSDLLSPEPFSSRTEGPITYEQYVTGAKSEGFDVRIASGATSLCFAPQSASEWPVLAGPDRRSLTRPIDLLTLRECSP